MNKDFVNIIIGLIAIVFAIGAPGLEPDDITFLLAPLWVIQGLLFLLLIFGLGRVILTVLS